MAIRAVIFDTGGVILLEAGEGLETKWERRLGLKEGEFLSFFFAKPLLLERLIGEDHGPCPGRF